MVFFAGAESASVLHTGNPAASLKFIVLGNAQNRALSVDCQLLLNFNYDHTYLDFTSAKFAALYRNAQYGLDGACHAAVQEFTRRKEGVIRYNDPIDRNFQIIDPTGNDNLPGLNDHVFNMWFKGPILT